MLVTTRVIYFNSSPSGLSETLQPVRLGFRFQKWWMQTQITDVVSIFNQPLVKYVV